VRSPYTALLLIFAASRIAYYLAGVRFDARGINTFFQLLDPELLRHRLLESLFYLHMQPPGFNFLVGVVLKMFPASYGAGLHWLHMLFGAATACLLFHLMRRLGVGTRLALVAAALFMVSPGVVLFENFVLYEYVLAFVLAASAVLLYHFAERRSAVYAVAFLACQFCLVMLRNQFHLVYFAVMFAVVLWFTRKDRRVVAGVGAVFLAVVLALFVKNLVLFGHFVSSTWMGMNMATIATHQLTAQERAIFMARGQLSPATSEDPGAPLSFYRPYIKMPAKTGIPALDEEFKSTGAVNFNHVAFLEVQKLYMKDGLFILQHYPKAYLRSVATAWFAYFLPTGDFPFFTLNRPRIHGLDRFFNVVFFGQFREAPDRKTLRRLYAQGGAFSMVLYTGLFLMIGLPALFVFGIWFLYRGVRTRSLGTPRALLLGFMLFNIAYLTGVANFLSCFENNRYRFQVDGFYVVLAALALAQLWRGLRRRNSARAQDRSLDAFPAPLGD
jgi:4-amino-4-deoxy-L-arabinose transferase-like glycosyltransferase